MNFDAAINLGFKKRAPFQGRAAHRAFWCLVAFCFHTHLAAAV